MKLWLTRPLPDAVEARARATFDVEIRPSNMPLSGEQLRQALRDYDIVMPTLGDRFQADVFDDVPDPRCKLLANFGVGYNHIDVEAARRHGIAVSNTPGAVTDATADIAMTLILMTARRAGEGERMLRAGQWNGWHPTQMLGLHVTGQTLGVVGMGRIGQAIARRCHFGFGMDVRYVSRSDKALAFPAARDGSLTELAGKCDILVVAVPGGAETHHLIDEAVFAAQQPHAIFVNIARGDVVDEAALVAALRAGQIAGAGLDVYEFEPQVPAALMAMENVTLLPHLGTAALNVRTDMGMMVLDNVQAFVEGRALPNPV
ncbi:D-glycerate dehydrogenase [Aestuariivita sp.]|jgi:hydroxypyruvate reductase|uniref:2-hydroxyacid dehydrogenase n=1 Tax=Aestuariivita sp. TaxID=1872407 RepID=UPI00216F8128|nr:D-glycerate dehydrogenase [Aestuariivita sp.]MCE8007757.1 D-glycerate dehydrogenase [Aestuariivita sp.]